MSQYFIETKTKQPQFFSFNRVLTNQEPDLDYDLIVKEFQENFDNEQQDSWIKHWNIQGEDIVLQTWNEKYKDYIQEGDNEKEKNTKILTKNAQEEEKDCNNLETKEVSAKNLEETTKFKSKETQQDPELTQHLETIEPEPEEHLVVDPKSWQDLWHEHREGIYLEQYLIYSTIFYNYFLDLKNSLETPITLTEDINEDFQEAENLKLTEELEQLKLLGLPTSFRTGPQGGSSKKTKNNKKSINFSDFFSDSEMENESSDTDIEEKSIETSASPLNDNDDSLHIIQNKLIQKSQKRRNRKLKNVPPFMLAEKGLLKYWRKRFSLFSRFDEGIRLDRESWFSVTPEKVAKHLADRLQCSILVDGFCGSGGNAIQFALTCQKVIAIDIDPVKLEMAKHNAEIYKVSHKIEFILGDFLQLAEGGKLKADTVFLSPPWGGPKYKNKKDFDIEKYLLPVKASELVEVSRNISENIALFLPRNSNVKQVVKLAGIGKRCEIEHNYLDSRLVAITALYGEDILEKKAYNTN